MADRAAARHAQLMVGLGLLVNVCLGTVYSWSVFRVPIEDEFAVGPVQSGLPYMLMLAFFSLSMPFAGRLQRVTGPRVTAMIGGLLLGAAWMAASFAGHVRALALIWGGVGGIGVGLTYGVPLALAHAWFPQRRGLAMGVALGGFGMSPFLTAPAAEIAVESFGLMPAFRAIGVAFAVLIPLLSIPFRAPREEETARLQRATTVGGSNTGTAADTRQGAAAGAGASTTTAGPGPGITTGEMVRRREFYVLWALFLLGNVIGLGAIAITAPWARNLVGMGAGAAAASVSILAIFNGVGRPLFGFLTDHIGLRGTATVAFAMTGTAALVLLLDRGNSAASFAVAFAIFWLLLGGWLAIAPAATAALFGPAHYAQNYGLVFQAYGVGAVAGTLVSGRLNELFGSYRAVLWPILILSTLGLAAAFFGLRYRVRSGQTRVSG